MSNLSYVLVSQGLFLCRFVDKAEALAVAKASNESYLCYKQKCLDDGELYVDNLIYVYEEKRTSADSVLIRQIYPEE